MTSEARLYSFFNSFTIPAYPSTDLSDKPLPHITYDAPKSFFGGGEVSCVVNIWYRTDSEAVLNAKVRELETALGRGGKILSLDNGSLWLKKGSPWCQSMNDEIETSIKRRYINITIEYLT